MTSLVHLLAYRPHCNYVVREHDGGRVLKVILRHRCQASVQNWLRTCLCISTYHQHAQQGGWWTGRQHVGTKCLMIMMTSSNGNISCVSGLLWGEFPGEFPPQKPVTRSFDGYFDPRPSKWLSKQSWGWWFETPSRLLWRHRNGFNRSNMLVSRPEYSCRTVLIPWLFCLVFCVDRSWAAILSWVLIPWLFALLANYFWITCLYYLLTYLHSKCPNGSTTFNLMVDQTQY